jgi:DNA-binding transcriptional LysR family regulator
MQKVEITRRAIIENLDKLAAFQKVAKSSSISRAAPHVHLSQSALSHLITNFEKAIGVSLFKRKPHGLELTTNGQILLDFSDRLLLDVESLSGRLNSAENQSRVNIWVGTHETLAAHIWPQTLADLAKQSSNLKISLLSGRIDGLTEMLVRGDLHATVTVRPRADARLRITPLYSGSLQFFVGANSPFAKKRVSLKNLDKTPFFTDSQAHVRQGLSIPEALQQLDLEDSGRFEVSSFEAAINLAEMNLGVAVLPDRNAQHAVKDGRIRQLKIQNLNVDLLKYEICLSTLFKADQSRVHDILFDCFKR